MRTLISVVALFVLFGADVFGAIGSWPKTTTYTRQFLVATNADAARTALGIVATNSDVLTVNETNSTSVTNLVGRIVTSNNIVVGTIGTNLLSQSAYDALVGGGDGGAGDATLAGNNTWTGSNVFTGELIGSSVIDGASFRVTSNLGDKFLFTNRVDEAESLYLDILGEAENRIVSFKWDNTADNGVISKNFYGSGAGLTNLNASNILTGTIDAARLPVVWTNAVAADGVEIEGVGLTNGVLRASVGVYSGSSSIQPGVVVGNVVQTSIVRPGNAVQLNIGGTMATNVLVPTNLIVGGTLSVGSGVTISSNSAASPPTLSAGDIAFLSQEGVPVVVSKDAGGVERTNRLDGVPAGIVTNNHASAVTFSNDVTVASNLVVQGSSTFETLNVGELNVTNLNVGTLYLTNGIIRTTNALAGVNVVMGSSWFTNALQPFTLSGCSNFDGTNEVSAVVRVLNSSATNISVTVPTAWRTPDGSRVLWVTNGALGIISVEVVGKQLTNAAMKCLW